MDLATRISTLPRFGLKLAKQAVNQTLDAQGHRIASERRLVLQQLGHSHNLHLFGDRVDPSGFPNVLKGKDPDGTSRSH